MAVNVHERRYDAAESEVAALIATLSSDHDRLWPHEHWPRMRLRPGLEVGATGGHGPVGYRVERLDPAGTVVFRFTRPRGFDGSHASTVAPTTDASTVLRHELTMRTRGLARVTWPLFFRPLHNALIEEAFDKAGRELGVPPATPHRRGPLARIIVALVARGRQRTVPR